MTRLALLVAATLVAGAAQADPYRDNVDVLFECNFPRPQGHTVFWVTVTGQDGDAYRFGAVTFQQRGAERVGDAWLYPTYAEFEFETGTPSVRYDHTSGAVVLTPKAGGAQLQGICKVRN